MPDPHQVPQDANGFFLEAPEAAENPSYWAHPLGVLTAEMAEALVSKIVS
jgi:hypothetical protein